MSVPETAPSTLDKEIRTTQAMAAALSHRFEDLVALQRLPKFPNERFLPWTRSALNPSTVLLLLNEIELHQHQCILELGSGISTLFISLILQGSKRRLISVDSDPTWQALVAQQATSLGLDLAPTSFVHAPLTPFSDQRFSGNWYNVPAIETAVGNDRVSCLLVDGPPAHQPRARYPALPALKHLCADDVAVYLDDCHRQGEQSIAKDWSSDFNLKGRFMPERGNVCLLYPANAKRFNVI